MITPLEENLIRQSSEIFTLKNLAAIMYTLDKLKPPYTQRCQGSEYETIVKMARLDGIDWLIQQVVEYAQKENKTIQDRP